VSADAHALRWTSTCPGCGRERELQTRVTRACGALCDECASGQHHPPASADSEFNPCQRPFDRPLDRLLLALRATRADAYRADERRVGTWRAFCPACATTAAAGHRTLTITEPRVGSPVGITCRNRCRSSAIYAAVHAAEAADDTSPARCAR
jgi:hypothetical protein